MGGIELLVLALLLLKGGSSRPSAPNIPAPTPSVPIPGPALPPARVPPVATAPASPGQPGTASQARAQTQAARSPQPFPQAVPPGLPPFPGPGWKPFVPTPPAVVTRAQQLLPVLWASGEGTRKQEQTAGTWTTYLAVRMGANGQLRGVTAHKLVTAAPAMA